jgi:hypothetical protein
MASDGHSPYIGENGNWWQWNDAVNDYVDTGVSAKGVPGMPGQVPVQKEWKAGDTHRNDTNIVDYIYVRAPIPDNRKWYKLKNDYVVREVPSDETYPSESTLSTYYDEIPWLKELAAKVLIGEEANLANLIFKDDKLISLRGTVDGVAADYSGQTNFVPNVIIDGKTGNIEAVSGKIGGMTIQKNRLESSSTGKRVIIDPENHGIIFKDSDGREIGSFAFTYSDFNDWSDIVFTSYDESDNKKQVTGLSNHAGYYVLEYTDGELASTKIRYGVDGTIYNKNLPDLTDTQADNSLDSGRWYRTGRIIKVKP